jgi:hypothetical protein
MGFLMFLLVLVGLIQVQAILYIHKNIYKACGGDQGRRKRQDGG